MPAATICGIAALAFCLRDRTALSILPFAWNHLAPPARPLLPMHPEWTAFSTGEWILAGIALGCWLSAAHGGNLYASHEWRTRGQLVVGIDGRALGTRPDDVTTIEGRLNWACSLLLASVLGLVVGGIACFFVSYRLPWWGALAGLFGGWLLGLICGATWGHFVSLPLVKRRHDRLVEKSRAVNLAARIEAEANRLIQELAQNLGGREVLMATLAKMSEAEVARVWRFTREEARRIATQLGHNEREKYAILGFCRQVRDKR